MSMNWATPESLEVEPDQLQVRLDFYKDSIVMYVIDGNRLVQTRMVSALDISQAFVRGLAISSGLLPADALWWSSAREGQVVALWRSPRVWKAALMLEANAPPRRFTLPMPGLIFLCKPGGPPYVFAAKKRPHSGKNKIYHAPLYNIFSEGRSCPGNHQYPDDIRQIPESFFASFFSLAGSPAGRSKKHGNNLLKLWEELDGQKEYPMADLVEFGKLEDIMVAKER